MEQSRNQTVKERLKSFIDYKKMSVRAFEAACGLSYGFVGNMRNSMQPDKIMKIVHCFPELNSGWVMTGDGDMLKDSVKNIAQGDHATNIAGNGNNIRTDSSTLDKALDEIAEQRKLVAKAQDQVSVAQSQVTVAMEQVSKSQQQIDRLLSILEMTNNV